MPGLKIVIPGSYPVLKVVFLALIFWSLSSTLSPAQITFFNTYGDTAESHYDQGHAVVQTADGGYVVAGEYGQYSVGTPSQFYGDVYLVRTDAYGDTLWTRRYGTPGLWEAADAMIQTSDGGFLLSACIHDPLRHLWLIRTDANGDSLWSRTYTVGKGASILETGDGCFILTGYGYGDQLNPILCLLKINRNGDKLWLKTFARSSQDEGTCVSLASDGGYLITGTTNLPEPQNLDIWLLKTDANGDTLWTRIYGGDHIDNARSACAVPDGGYLLAGEYTVDGPLGLELHIWLLRTDGGGDTLWTRKINNGSWGDYAYAMHPTTDGGYLLAGETYYDTFDSDIYLLKLDATGSEEWASTIGQNLGGIGDERQYRANDARQTSDGGYIITGFKATWLGWDCYQDLCLLKVNNKGQHTGIETEQPLLPSQARLVQNYPNPFNPVTTLSYTLAKRGLVHLSVYDITGALVFTPVQQQQQAGEYRFQFDGTFMASGVYLYQLVVDHRIVATRKMVLIK